MPKARPCFSNTVRFLSVWQSATTPNSKDTSKRKISPGKDILSAVSVSVQNYMMVMSGLSCKQMALSITIQMLSTEFMSDFQNMELAIWIRLYDDVLSSSIPHYCGTSS
ncbi:hypothetical protein AVEN_89935-1 [Araneus ventricosus]|uniref:Uncharacterized protein n=1 Tax=Araneus ventricosus TaxID=182803 RepID=A0A4Y2TI64_ARAVE|nr:hypothetical protein AVEN_89935-1 [Araneus ventricosus]